MKVTNQILSFKSGVYDRPKGKPIDPSLGVSHLQTPDGKSLKVPGRPRVFILSDIDGTWWGGDKKELQKLNDGMKDIWKKHDAGYAKDFNFNWGYISARPPERITESGVRMPPYYTVAYNGGEFYRGIPHKFNKVKEWDDILAKSNFDSQKVLKIAEKIANNSKFKGMQIETIGQVVKNPAADACKYIATICVHNDSIKLDASKGEAQKDLDHGSFKAPQQVIDLMKEIQKQAEKAGIKSEATGPYPFKGKPYVMFDVAAPLANKGSFVDYFMKDYVKNNKPENFIIAADGGNDLSMMKDDGRRVIIVGPNQQLREAAAKFKKNTYIIRPPDENSSKGVLEGIKIHLDQIQKGIKKSIAFSGRLLAGKQNAGKQKDAA